MVRLDLARPWKKLRRESVKKESAKPLQVPPEGCVSTWIEAVTAVKALTSNEKISGALGKWENAIADSCDSAGLPDRKLVNAAYKLLRRTIRNRDAHFYAKSVREQQLYLVPELFVPCFNAMCEAQKMREVFAMLHIASCKSEN